MKKFKWNLILIPLITIAVALIGNLFTRAGMEWYNAELIKPGFTPEDWLFPVAWTTIFILTTLSAILIWNKDLEKWRRISVATLFGVNAFLNVAWSFLFFYKHLFFTSLLEMLFLEVTIIALMILIWRKSKIAVWLLIPYLGWVGLASYLTYKIIELN